MAASKTTPTGVERTFADDEIIVSKTAPNGTITYVNDVFIRVSGFTEAELLGAPHSIIRHPDMPRGVFKLLWETVQNGDELFAYVVNLTKVGDHYWVFGHITPTFGHGGRIVGFHSNRRTPRREILPLARDLYGRMLAREQQFPSKVEAAEAGKDLLLRWLADQGITYEEWIWASENGTLANRAAAVLQGV